MRIEEAILFYGSGSKLCKELGITRQCITNWRKRGFMPMLQQLKLEKITKGKLKADKELI